MHLVLILLAIFVLSTSAFAQETEQLTYFDGADTDPAISPDGQWMMYSSDRQKTGKFELWAMNLVTGEDSQFLQDVSVSSPVAWESTGAGFLAALSIDGGVERIRYVDFNTRSFSDPLFPAPPETTQLFPALSHDNQATAFAMLSDSDTADWDLYLGDRDTGEMTVVAQSPYRDLWPRFEKGGKSLIYFSRRDTGGEDDEIYRYDLEAASIQALTRSPGHDFTPHPSPDGKFIAFVSKRSTENAVFLMGQGGLNVRRVSPPGFRAGHPAWGSESKTLYMTLRVGGNTSDIYKIQVDVD
jgi:TolB protein